MKPSFGDAVTEHKPINRPGIKFLIAFGVSVADLATSIGLNYHFHIHNQTINNIAHIAVSAIGIASPLATFYYASPAFKSLGQATKKILAKKPQGPSA